MSYGPSFSVRLIHAWAINERKKRGSVAYSTDRENEVNKIFIILSEVNRARGKGTLNFQI